MECPHCHQQKKNKVCEHCGKELNLSEKNKRKKIIKTILGILSVLIVISAILFFSFFGLKKETTMEIGTKNIELKDFYKHEFVFAGSKLKTDMKKINFNKVGKHQILIDTLFGEKKVTLNLVDTTPPKVKFQDVVQSLDYQINPEDFIVSKEDLSKMTVELKEKIEIKDYKDYKVTILVKDQYNNITEKECNLKISLIKPNLQVELGNPLTKQDLLYEPEKYGDLIKQEEIDKINNSGIGDYEIKIRYGNNEFTSKIKVQDTKGPDLELQDITIYDDQTVNGKEAFIKSVHDASSEVTTTLKTEIDYTKIGTQTITIEAIDKYNNVTTKTANLTIRKDTEAPNLYGLNALTVNKYTNVDLYKGVSAWDEHDGNVSVQIQTNGFTTSKYGTYYVTYTATDKVGNTVSKKRKIIVNHDQEDTNQKIREVASTLSGNYEEIRRWVHNNIRYNSNYGNPDPIWYGLTNKAGNCVVHAEIYKALLEQKGYEVMLIWTTDKSHYWNLVKINGVWRHSDSTPTDRHNMISAATDAERLAHLQGRDWDHSKWPKAE